MRALFFLSFILGISPSFALIPFSNGVLQTSHAVDTLLDAQNAESLYSRCQSQSPGARYFSNSCTTLIDHLRKRMDSLAMDADLQIQSEKLAKPRLSKVATARINVLSRINLLSTQAAEALKTAESKEDLPAALSTVQKVQTTVQAYGKLFPGSRIEK